MKSAFESKINATREPAAPINLHILDLMDVVEEELHKAEGRTIADLVQQPAKKFVMWGKRVEDDKVVYLDGVDRALRIRVVHQKASDAVGLAPTWRKRHAPCPDCGIPCLGSWSGTDTIHCTNEDCLATYTLSEYETYCIDKANETHA